MAEQLEFEGILSNFANVRSTPHQQLLAEHAELVGYAEQLVKQIEMAVGTAKIVDQNNIQITVALPMGVWNALCEVAKEAAEATKASDEEDD